MGLDHNLLEQKLFQLDNYMNYLQRYQKIPYDDFHKNPDYFGATERFLQISLEICIDIGNHILGRKRWRKPDSYSDIFKILEENDVISATTADFMVQVARFRNLLVHHYFNIDRKRVYEILTENLTDLEVFTKEIYSFLKQEKES